VTTSPTFRGASGYGCCIGLSSITALPERGGLVVVHAASSIDRLSKRTAGQKNQEQR
jgi:hypothetical protein